MHAVAFLIGTSLWLGATALLVEDAFHSGHLTVTHALQPLLTAGTVAAAVWVHRARWLAKPGFLALAVLGSLVTVYGTMGRQAETGDGRRAEATATNAALTRKLADLQHAKAEQAKECRVIGKRCQAWNERVDKLSAELEGRAAVTVDPRQAAVVKLATLAGLDGAHVAQVVSAVDPIALPLFLELGSVLFFAVAFPKPVRNRQRLPGKPEQFPTAVAESEKVSTLSPIAFCRDAALADFRRLRETGAQKVLANRWGVSEGTVSKWLGSWEHDGLIARRRAGKVRPVLALPAPASIAP